MPLSILVMFGIGVPFLLYGFRMFDRIVRTEYEKNRSEWEEDGKPYGFFWRAPECTFFRSGWARNWLSLSWLFITPLWAAETEDCLVWLRRFRICVFAWNLLMVIAFFVIASR